jgi:hypothetical protein
MPPTDGKLGDLHVTLRADTAQFEAGMRSAQTTAEQTSTRVEQSVLKQAGAFRQLVGRVAGSIAVFGTFFRIGQQIGQLFDDITPKVELFMQSISKREAADQLAEISKRLVDLQNANTGTLANDLLNLSQGQTTAQVRREIEQLEGQRALLELSATNNLGNASRALGAKQLDEYKRKVDAERKIYRDGIKSAEDAAERSSDAAAQAEINNLEGVTKARAQAEFDIANLRQEIRNAQSVEEIAALNRQIAARGAALALELDQERLQVLRDQTKELLRQQEIFADLQQRQVGAFGFGGMEATLKAIRGDLQSIRGVIR